MGITVLVVVALGAAFVVLPWMFDRVFSSADRAIRHKTYEKGQQEARTTLHFTAPTTPASLLDAIVSTVNAHSSAPAIVGGLYVRERTDVSVGFALGNAIGNAFVAEVTVEAMANTTKGLFVVEAWREEGADVAGTAEMKRLRERITEAVTTAGGSVEEGLA